MANQHIAENYATALASWDIAGLRELIHPNITVRYPQSGETFHGFDRYLATIEEYPDLPDLVDVSTRSQHRESVVVAPGLLSPIVTVIGDGDRFVAEFEARYPNGDTYHVVSIVRIADGLIIEDTAYFGAPFDPPQWRAKYRSD